MKNDDKAWVLLDTFNYMHEYLTLKLTLESEGIETLLKDELTISIDPLLSNAIGGIKLFVRESDAERALAVYRQFFSNRNQAPPEDIID